MVRNDEELRYDDAVIVISQHCSISRDSKANTSGWRYVDVVRDFKVTAKRLSFEFDGHTFSLKKPDLIRSYTRYVRRKNGAGEQEYTIWIVDDAKTLWHHLRDVVKSLTDDRKKRWENIRELEQEIEIIKAAKDEEWRPVKK